MLLPTPPTVLPLTTHMLPTVHTVPLKPPWRPGCFSHHATQCSPKHAHRCSPHAAPRLPRHCTAANIALSSNHPTTASSHCCATPITALSWHAHGCALHTAYCPSRPHCCVHITTSHATQCPWHETAALSVPQASNTLSWHSHCFPSNYSLNANSGIKHCPQPDLTGLKHMPLTTSGQEHCCLTHTSTGWANALLDSASD
jgi:hypothetical protein